MALIVNLFGAPGAGKSTGAAYIFSQLKLAGINAELVTEFAKDKVWEETKEVFNNQAYIFGKQYFRISRCANKVDVIITDSPLPLSCIYNNNPVLGEDFNKVVFNVFNSYENLNFFINRVKPYNPVGRFQSEKESDEVSVSMLEFLSNNNIEVTRIDGNTEGYWTIIAAIIKKSLEREDKKNE